MTSNTLHVAVTGFSGLDRCGPGLSVARALRDGWPDPLSITAVVSHESTPAAWMPGLIDRIVVVPPGRSRNGPLAERLLSLHEQAPIAAVLAGTNTDAAGLAKAKSRLDQAGIGTALPDAATIEQLEPCMLHDRLTGAGLQMPAVTAIARYGDLSQVAETLAYPVTLSDDQGFRSIVYGAAQMRALVAYRASDNNVSGLTVQSFVYGDTYVAACLAEVDGPGPMVVARCLGVGSGGQVTAATVIDDPDIADTLRKVVAVLQWNGPIEVEVKRRAGSHELVVTDVQCRLPSWCMLTHWSGANLAAAMLDRIRGSSSSRGSVRPGTMFVTGVCETAVDLDDYFQLKRRQSIGLPQTACMSGSGAKAKTRVSSNDTGRRIAVTGLSTGDVVNPGIGVARALRAADGISGLYGLGYNGFDAGAYEPGLFDQSFHLDFPESTPQFQEQVLAAHARAPFDVLIPCLDGELPFAIDCADELAEHGIAMLLPTDAAFERRAKLNLFGPDLDPHWGAFSLPDSVIAESEKEARKLARDFGLPAVAKGALSHCIPVQTVRDVDAAWHQLAAMGSEQIVLQERLAGPSYAVSVVCDRNHDVVSSLAIKKIALCSRGSTWSAINVKEPELERSFARFLKAIEWIGPAEGEFIRDDATDRFFLFEVNPRFTAWISFSSALGHNQPLLAASLAGGHQVELPPVSASRIFVRGCSEIKVNPARLAAFTKRRSLWNDHTKAL